MGEHLALALAALNRAWLFAAAKLLLALVRQRQSIGVSDPAGQIMTLAAPTYVGCGSCRLP